MAKLKELTVWMENKPGTLAAMAEALSIAKVNILAFMADEAEGQSRVRLVTDNPARQQKPLPVSICDSHKRRSSVSP